MRRTIIIDSKEYPMRGSLGAMRLFKQQTGREISEVKENEISELAVFLWCCVAAECRRCRIDFAVSLDDFCDALDPDALALLSEEAKEEATATPEPEETGKKAKKK